MTYLSRVRFGDMVYAIGEFIGDTPVHKGQKRNTIATNFGTKMALNAFLRDIARTGLRITGGFHASS